MCLNRAIAACLDHILILEFMAFIVNVTPVLNPTNSVTFDNHFDSTTSVIANDFGLVVYIAGYIAYFSVSEALFGATLFKRLFGIRVVRGSQDRIPLGYAIVRTITKPLEFFPLFWPFSIGWIVFGPKHRRFGDTLAGTTVMSAAAHRAVRRNEEIP